MTTDDVIARGRRELWDYETYGSFWDGDTVMAELIAELEAVRAEAAQWKLLWKQNTETASDAIRERDEVEKENSRLRGRIHGLHRFCRRGICAPSRHGGAR